MEDKFCGQTGGSGDCSSCVLGSIRTTISCESYIIISFCVKKTWLFLRRHDLYCLDVESQYQDKYGDQSHDT